MPGSVLIRFNNRRTTVVLEGTGKQEIVERRSEHRFSCDAPAEITLINPGGSILTVPATLRDVSRSGLRVASNARLQRGMQIRVKLENLIVFGETCYCRLKNGTYESGIKTSDVISHSGCGHHLRDDQIELLALGRRLPLAEALYTKVHIRSCAQCAQELDATQSFFRGASPADL